MSSQTFEGVDGTRLLHIKNLGKRVTMSIEVPGQVHMGITFDPASIPALALAELEAAGYDDMADDANLADVHAFNAMHKLQESVDTQERATAEAKEQAELEAEALELLNASRESNRRPTVETFDGFESTKHSWLAVARKAREMRTEK